MQTFAYRYLDCTAWIAGFFKATANLKRQHAARRRSATVEARVLRDIGISEAQRFIEVNKSFWEK